MKKSIITLVIAFGVILMSGCAKWDGNPITKTFSIKGNYTELEVEDAFSVFVSDTVDQVVITAGDNIMPYVVVKEEGKTLNIYIKGWRSNRGSELKVILPYNAALTTVDLSGASDFHSTFGLKGTEVDVDLSGSSDFFCDIEADKADLDLTGASYIGGRVMATTLDLDMSGSSDATLEGTVGTFFMDLSGASILEKKIVNNRYSLVCNRCLGSLSGSSDAYIHSDGNINVSLSGSSDLYYTGNATTRGCSTTGGSSITHDQL